MNTVLTILPGVSPGRGKVALYLFILTQSVLTLSAQANLRHCVSERSIPNRIDVQARAAGNEKVLYVPVVFHVVYATENQNISDNQIYSQLAVINEDYSKRNKDTVNTLKEFKSLAANTEIQFYIATRGGVQGITRTKTSHAPFYNDDLHVTKQGGEDGWSSENYLNVWIAALAPGIFGYGTAPGTPAFRDGVAIHFEYFGREGSAVAPYHLGRTLTHEIGHWLGLEHPWGIGGCNSDDGIDDTPLQNAPSSGCNLNQHSCGTLNMVQNFMNTSDDACMTLFTLQQRNAMRNTLIAYRPSAYTDQSVVTSLKDAHAEEHLVVYPNPVIDSPVAHLRLNRNTSNAFQIVITDVYGRSLNRYTIHEPFSEIDVDMEGLSNGIYIARIYNNEVDYSARIYLNIK